MKILQGDIYLANLNPTKGHEQSGYRPVLVLQNNIFNNILNTIVIAPITANLAAKGKLTTYFLSKKQSRLKQDSVILLFQIRTIDIIRLNKKIVNIKYDLFLKIKDQLRYIF